MGASVALTCQPGYHCEITAGPVSLRAGDGAVEAGPYEMVFKFRAFLSVLRDFNRFSQRFMAFHENMDIESSWRTTSPAIGTPRV